jgi:cytochrome c-type biogenesis protein CcmH
MIQHATRTYPVARIALLVAALAAAFAVGFAISRGGDGDVANELANPNAVAAITPISELEKRVEASPEDPKAWRELGQAYYNDSLFADAARSYEKATVLVTDDAMAWSALGEALVMASQREPMPTKALAAFRRAVALDAEDPRARYFLAVKRDIDGDHQGAIADWLTLLEATPMEAPWRTDLVRTIEQVGKINGIDVAARLAAAGAKSPPAPPQPAAARAIPGPSSQDLAAASQIPPGEQREMAEGMVARLESRLKGDPANVDGWLMLIRSRATLGQSEKASRALKDAVAANPAEAAEIQRQAAMLGVK